ncbi:hypothetical protein AVT69_gp121 [Pseudomonas phage PhiPA3]|uniref:Uncharacterized protein 122 n=1 Tax=Pseudomonas phage PhiPA3 TaxID=998086 RepID=F8SJZ6_BPPA3|nr:hypothetical protein AVT69_gp121 [Pseudomonas phage PhiPA3]AEH03546.1 hypothetical protein [Pseudomonas phage PhiPA3]
MTHRPTQEQLQHFRSMREARRVRFNPAHLPQGTVVEAELPTLKNYDNPEQMVILPGDVYPRGQFTVDYCGRNGADSWYVVCFEEDEGLGIKRGFNISWVRKIISRGTGPVLTDDPNRDTTYRPNMHPPRYRSFPKPKNAYYMESLRMGVHGILQSHPAFKDRCRDHLYDLEKITAWLENHPTIQAGAHKTTYIHFYVINKRKFLKLLEQAMTYAKTSRRKEQERNNRLDYEASMRDLDSCFDDDDDIPVVTDEDTTWETHYDPSAEDWVGN